LNQVPQSCFKCGRQIKSNTKYCDICINQNYNLTIISSLSLFFSVFSIGVLFIQFGTIDYLSSDSSGEVFSVFFFIATLLANVFITRYVFKHSFNDIQKILAVLGLTISVIMLIIILLILTLI